MTPLVLIAVLVVVIALVAWRVTRRLLVGVGVLVAAAGIAGFLVWSLSATPQPWSQAVQVDSQTLNIEYVGGSCEDQRSVSVDQGDDAVRIEIVTRSFASACDDMGNARTVAVELDRPLGDRRLIDGSCESGGSRSECSRGAAKQKAVPVG